MDGVDKVDTEDTRGKTPSGIYCDRLGNGVLYANLHYSADPDKDRDWVAREKAAMTEREWLIEMEMQELHLDGKPVHPSFRAEVHAPLPFRARPIPLVNGSVYIAGHDCGTASLNPASVLLQVTPPPHQVHLLGECIAEPGTSFEVYAPAFVNWMAERFPGISCSTVLHGGDETARARNGITGETAQEVAARNGIVLNLVSNRWADRRGAVDRLLASMIREKTPQFVLSVGSSPVCFDALQGGYRLKQVTQGVNALYGEPAKDRFSHPMDALQYAAILFWEWLASHGGIEKSRRGKARVVEIGDEVD